MLKHLRAYFLTGLFVLLPLVVTLKLIFWGFEKADAILGSLINWYLFKYFNLFGLHITKEIPGLGLVTLLIIITLAGVFARNYLGRKFIKFGESILERIPVLNSIYSVTKQVTEGFAMTRKEKGAFRQVVLVEYPRKGIYSPGFVTGETANEFKNKTGQELLAIFVPTVPNPTTGFLVYLPADEVIFLNMSVEEGLKLVLSFGMIKPVEEKEGPSVETAATVLKPVK